MQSKVMSFVEISLNLLSGYFLSLLVTEIVFPLYGLESNLSQNMEITAIYTVVSLIRSYVFRRVFNYFTMKGKD